MPGFVSEGFFPPRLWGPSQPAFMLSSLRQYLLSAVGVCAGDALLFCPGFNIGTS
jgi:hypothetical protein